MSEENDDWNNWKITGPKALPEKLPPPTVWPITISFGVILLAFGVLTSPDYVCDWIDNVSIWSGWLG